MSESSGGVVSNAMDALAHVLQRRRWRSRSITGAGGLIVQFWRVHCSVCCTTYVDAASNAEGKGRKLLTRHITSPHLLQPPTMSLAQSPDLPP